MTTSTPTSTPTTGMTSRILTIDGMTGDECVKKVVAAIKAVPNVTSTNVSVGAATITADAAGSASAREAIGRAGFKSRESNKGNANGPAHTNTHAATPAHTNAPAPAHANAAAPTNTPSNGNRAGDATVRAGTPTNTHAPVKGDASTYSSATRPGEGECTNSTAAGTTANSTTETKPDAMKACCDAKTDMAKGEACVKPDMAKTDACVKPEVAKA